MLGMIDRVSVEMTEASSDEGQTDGSSKYWAERGMQLRSGEVDDVPE